MQVVIDKPEPTFEDLAAAALANADIDTLDCLRAARAAMEAAAAAQVQASRVNLTLWARTAGKKSDTTVF